jgi:STIP1 family protein 1
MEILKDPVITPSGITYEKSARLEHLQKVGEFDPVTRELLRSDQIIPNFAIKAAASAYLKDNGWAYKHQ